MYRYIPVLHRVDGDVGSARTESNLISRLDRDKKEKGSDQSAHESAEHPLQLELTATIVVTYKSRGTKVVSNSNTSPTFIFVERFSGGREIRSIFTTGATASFPCRLYTETHTKSHHCPVPETVASCSTGIAVCATTISQVMLFLLFEACRVRLGMEDQVPWKAAIYRFCYYRRMTLL